MPIRFVSVRSAYGNAAVNLADLSAEFVGDTVEPILFNAVITSRLQDIGPQFVGEYREESNYLGSMAATVGGLTSNFVGDTEPFLIAPPPSVSFEFL